MIAIIVLIIVLLLIGVYIVSQYNSLIKFRNWVKESWSQIDVQLKRRHDLIPNLVNTVKGYAEHEKETLEKVIQARNQLISGTPQERIEADKDRKSTRLNSSHVAISYAVSCLKKK